MMRKTTWYRLIITYHGDEDCSGWGGGARFWMDFNTREEWVRRATDACSIISEIIFADSDYQKLLDLRKDTIVREAIALAESRKPPENRIIDLFVPCERQRLEAVFGHFKPFPVSRKTRKQVADELNRCREILGQKNEEARALPVGQRFAHVRKALFDLKQAEYEERLTGYGCECIAECE